jgi:hypothetical protein
MMLTGTDHRAVRLCHPEPKAKNLATGWGVLQIRSPDPSLHCAPFRMTYYALAAHLNECEKTL